MPRREEIEAAIAAYNDDDRQRLLLPPEAARLLATMFPRVTVYRGTVARLVEEGSNRRTVIRLLDGLVEAGFLSKEAGRPGVSGVYHLHLPPRRQP